uniref:C2H2-type domain-containing protein n=1 Tax=Cacopsylla melanoneura TaxID=428564 RepID=A0A8D8RQS5_9HEMI
MRRDKGSEVSSNEPLTAASQHGLLSTPIQRHNENTPNMNKNNEMEPTTILSSPPTATPQGNPKDNRHSPGVLINSAGHFMTDDDPNDTSPSGIRTVDSGGIRTVDSHPQCEVCHLAFMNQKLLNKHKKMHQVREFLTNPFQCKQCKFRTCNQVNLNAHMKRAHLTTRCRGK